MIILLFLKGFFMTSGHTLIECLMVLKYTMDKTIKQNVMNFLNAKAIIDLVVKKFVKFSKVE